MLTKKQLEDAANCWSGNCYKCSCKDLQKEHGAFDCMLQAVLTALALIDTIEAQQQEIEQKNKILEQAREALKYCKVSVCRPAEV